MVLKRWPQIRRVVVSSIRPLFILQLVALNLVVQATAAHVMDAYRLVQFDRGTQTLGSRRTILNHLATTVKAPVQTGPPPPPPPPQDVGADGGGGANADAAAPPTPPPPVSAAASAAAKDLARKFVVLHIRQLTPALITEVLDRRGAIGLLIVLPPESELNGATLNGDDLVRWQRLEQFLMSREWQAPIYFAFEDSNLSEIVQRVTADPDGANDRYQFVVSSAEGSAIPTVTIHNFHGWHHSTPSSTVGDAETIPTIAIVADYDTFAAAPSLATGVDQNGSGMIAVLELIRVFGRLYSEFRTHGAFNMLFILNGGGRLNQAGLRHWLKSADQRVIESIDFALCLDSIAGGDQLYLHVSKNASKSEQAAAMYGYFTSTASELNIPFDIIHRKINISSAVHQWPHEQFSRKHVLSGTLSSYSEPAPLWFGGGGSGSNGVDRRASIFDRRRSNGAQQTDLLVRNIKFIAEALCKKIYASATATVNKAAAASSTASKAVDLIASTHDVNRHFVNGWLDFLATQPRMNGHPSSSSPSAAAAASGSSSLRSDAVLYEAEKLFNALTADPKRASFPLEAAYKFYTSTTEQMSIYSVAPLSFDLYLCLAVCTYLGVLHLIVRAASDWDSFVDSLPFKLGGGGGERDTPSTPGKKKAAAASSSSSPSSPSASSPAPSSPTNSVPVRRGTRKD